MSVRVAAIQEREQWNATLAQLPYAHVLQTWEWGAFKAATTGWQANRLAFMRGDAVIGMAQVLMRQEGPLRIMYVPKGPVLDYANLHDRAEVLGELQRYARDGGAIFVKIDPDVVIGVGVPGEAGTQDDGLGQQIRDEWERGGWQFSQDQIQFRNSVVIDLRLAEDDLMAAMKQKTRYNVRLADRRDVDIRFGTADDLDLLYELYRETALRDGFIIRPLSYYRQAWSEFMQAGLAQPIIAEHKGEAIAHVIIFGFGKRAWYFYGASSDEHRNRMPTYALQWAAIRWAKAQKMIAYDMWGAPDDFYDDEDPLAGVYRFKSGFGGTVVRRIGAWDHAPNPMMYGAYTSVMPTVIGVMRQVGQIRQRLGRSNREDD
ncbi:MAG: peptidoglycan bridge formation glycyltransferase FemA/FemB family protein [Chloroflexi bacterium]|nr:peptidoglycan bridge formation glycyltransferase FemA/FemB family protein [Chloroflexota bacterium]